MRRTLKHAEADLQVARNIAAHYEDKYKALFFQKGDQNEQKQLKADVIKAVSELATANAKLTYAISRVIEMSTK